MIQRMNPSAVLTIFVVAFAFTAAAYSSSIELAWDASPGPDIAGYNVYRSSQSGNFTSGPMNGPSLISTTWFTDFNVGGGTYYYVVKAVNSGGEESEASNEVRTTVDTQAGQSLTAPTGLTSHCSNDARTFTVSWNPVTEAESYYLRVDYLGNNVNGQVYFTSGLDYYIDRYPDTSFTGNVIPGQGYNWWVHAYSSQVGDIAGWGPGIGPLSASTLTCASEVDVTPPIVSITAPLQGAAMSSSAGITVSASAVDDVGVAGVQFKLNGANLGAEITTAPYTVLWNAKKAAAGIYTIQAVARDAAGNQAVSAPISVTIAKRNGSVLSESAMASDPLREGRLYVNVDGRVNTGLFMVNEESEDAVISFYFTDAKGYDFGHGRFTLEAKDSVSAFVNEAPFNLAKAFEGTLTFYSSQPVTVTGLRRLVNERDDFLITAIPAISPVTAMAARSVVLPHFADGGGWSTQVVLINPTDHPIAGTVQFFGLTADGVTDPCFDYAIPPRTSARVATSNGGSQVQSGYVVATAREGHAAPHVFSMFSFSNQEATVSQTSVPAVSSGTAFRTYAEKLETVRSGFAIANPSAASTWTTFELLSIDGSFMNMSASMEIPARGHIAQFIDDLFPAIPEGFQGMLRIVATHAVGVIGLRFENNERGDWIVTGMPVINLAAEAKWNL